MGNPPKMKRLIIASKEINTRSNSIAQRERRFRFGTNTTPLQSTFKGNLQNLVPLQVGAVVVVPVVAGEVEREAADAVAAVGHRSRDRGHDGRAA